VSLAAERIEDPEKIPRCPRCGGPVMLNVRGGDWFIEDPYVPQGRRFADWLQGTSAGRLLVLDVGTGVIRWPVERITADHPRATLVRVNLHHPATPAALGARAIGIASTGAALWAALSARTAA